MMIIRRHAALRLLKKELETVEALPLIRSILSASDAALCRQHRWWSSDAECLDRALSAQAVCACRLGQPVHCNRLNLPPLPPAYCA